MLGGRGLGGGGGGSALLGVLVVLMAVVYFVEQMPGPGGNTKSRRSTD